MTEGSFVRWQTVALNQLTNSVNLILGFSTATLAYGSSLLRDDKFLLTDLDKWMFALSLLALSFSTLTGVWCTVNRLRDFRLTAKIARKRESGNQKENELEALRIKSAKLGGSSWKLFWWQLGLFVVGILFFVFFGVSHSYSLHPNQWDSRAILATFDRAERSESFFDLHYFFNNITNKDWDVVDRRQIKVMFKTRKGLRQADDIRFACPFFVPSGHTVETIIGVPYQGNVFDRTAVEYRRDSLGLIDFPGARRMTA